ncbi:MAG: hypothetical protein VX938_01965, partial [Myxococcota bacterium]|nr:hypothetical protein [Myxococcota bacterium]
MQTLFSLARALVITVTAFAPAILISSVASAAELDDVEPSLAVLEIHVRGEEIPKTSEYVRRITSAVGETGRFAMLDSKDAKKALVGHLAKPHRKVTEAKLQEIEAKMKQGDELTYTDPQQAILILAEAKTDLQVLHEGAMLNRKIRADLFRTQMLLARSHFDNGNEDKVREILGEIVRDFGAEHAVTEEEYHPDIVTLYTAVQGEMEARKVGKLKVETNPPGATIYLNGREEKTPSPGTYGKLYPGAVKVSARIGKRDSLVHEVNVSLDKVQSVTIDIDFEAAVAIDSNRFGLVFDDADVIAEQVADFGSRVGELLDVEYVLVSGLVTRGGKAALEGYLVDVGNAVVVLQKSDSAKTNVVSKKRVADHAVHMASLPRPSHSFRARFVRPTYAWVGLGTGIASAAVGAGLLASFNSKLEEVQCTQGPEAGCKNATERGEIAESAKLVRMGAYTFLTVSAVGIVAGSTILAMYLSGGGEEEDTASGDGIRLQAISPLVVPEGAGLGA